MYLPAVLRSSQVSELFRTQPVVIKREAKQKNIETFQHKIIQQQLDLDKQFPHLKLSLDVSGFKKVDFVKFIEDRIATFKQKKREKIARQTLQSSSPQQGLNAT